MSEEQEYIFGMAETIPLRVKVRAKNYKEAQAKAQGGCWESFEREFNHSEINDYYCDLLEGPDDEEEEE